MAKKADLVNAVKELGNPEAWKYFCSRREVAREAGLNPVDAAVQAHAETFSKFGADGVKGVAAESLKPTSGLTLYDRDEFEKTEPLSPSKTMVWVDAMMLVDGLEPADAPNSAAWGMLMWCRESAANRASFYTNILPKLLPNKTQLEQESRFHDDGRELSDFIGRIRSNRQAAVLQGGAKRALPKPAFS